jgi:MFS family permease
MPQPTNPYASPSAEANPPSSGKTLRQTSLLLVFVIVCIDLLGFGLVLPLLPIYGEKLAANLPKGQVGMIVGGLMLSFPLMQFLFSPIWGRLSDHLGRRPVLLLSLAGSCLFYVGFGVASLLESLTWMFVSRIGAGIAAATIPTAQAYIADVTPPEKRARGMAMIGAAFGLGFTLGPLIGAAAIFFSRDQSAISPWPGFAAAILSGVALLVAALELPESLRADEIPGARRHFDLAALRDILSVPSLGLLLVTSFVAVFSLANFESTLSFTIREEIRHVAGKAAGGAANAMPEWIVEMRLMLVFAYIGVIQCLVQGILVRRLANHWKEAMLATVGSVLSIGGFVMLAVLEGGARGGIGWLMVATAVEVSGIAFVFPAISALVSRRSDPAKQGGILGAGESVGSIARIAGFGAGVPLYFLDHRLPFETAAVLMASALVLILIAVRIGRDWSERG